MSTFISNTVQVHVISFEVPTQEPKFLTLQRASHSKLYPLIWQVITGKIESDETALLAALREMKEETGLFPVKLWAIPYVTTFFEVKKDLIHASPVFGALVDSKSQIKLSPEHLTFEWLSYKDCMNRLYLSTHKEGTRVFKDYIIDNTNKDLFIIENFDDNSKV
jgi:dATP pyrophosphohydrolase